MTTATKAWCGVTRWRACSRAELEGKEATVGPMDPLLEALATYSSPAELQQSIIALFKARRGL